MILRKGGYGLLRFFSYGVLILLLLLLSNPVQQTLIIPFIMVLLFIFNSVLRLFTFNKTSKSSQICFYISILIEFIIGYFICDMMNWNSFIVFFITILDIGYYAYRPAAIVTLSCAVMYAGVIEYLNHTPPSLLVMNMIGIISFSILAVYMKEEESKKLRAQELYDRLRESEEALGQAYKELEMYANTVEELTLLRERTRVSRELHDSVGHSLSALYIQLKAVKTLVHKAPEQAEQMIEMNSNYVHTTLQEVRNTVHQLKPKEFEDAEGIFIIEEMVKNFKAMTGVDVRFILSKEKGIMTSEQGQHLYRIIQEALGNAVNHGKAKSIQIIIQFKMDRLYVYIKDDGVGCKDITEGFGLTGMRERATALGGDIQFISNKNTGFEIQLTLPRFTQTVNDDVIKEVSS